MSVASQCQECCTCPTSTVEWDSVSASKEKCGAFVYNESGGAISGKRFRRVDISGSSSKWNSNDCTGFRSSHVVFSGYSITDDCSKLPSVDACSIKADEKIYGDDGTLIDTVPICGTGARPISESKLPATTRNETKLYYDYTCTDLSGFNLESQTSSAHNDLSDEYTTTQLKTNTLAALPAYDNDWNDTAGSFANLSTDELSYSIRESRYRLRFKIPQVRTAKCYRLSWVEQFIPEAGTSISSVEVYSPGVYRPTVTISGGNGTGAIAIAVMSSTGTVSSIRILNPGSGYTSAPIVTVQTAINSGTTATGWTATLTDDQVTSISGGSGGDYRPTLTFSAPPSPGTTATGTCTVDERGGIDAVSVTASGSGYTSAPALTITSKVSGTTAADLLLHLGTETTKCATWDGTTPGGYDPATPSTYPILGDGTNPYFSLAVPTSDGITLVANVRAVCDCSSCS